MVASSLNTTSSMAARRVGGGGGGYPLQGPKRGGSVRMGYLFQASGIRKGRDFTS